MSKPIPGSTLDPLHPMAPRVGYWLMNEGAGATVDDLVSGMTGTLTSDVVWSSDAGGPLLNWPTPNAGYVRVPSTPSFGPAITLACRVMTRDALEPVSQMFVERSPINACWALFVEAGILIWRASSGNNRASVPLVDIGWTDNVEHTVEVTDDGTIGGHPKLYLDGVPLTTTDYTGDALGTTGDLSFGAYDHADSQYNLHGTTRWVYIDDAERSDADAASLHASPYQFLRALPTGPPCLPLATLRRRVF